MINQFEVPTYLEEQLPGISCGFKNGENGGIYNSVHIFLDYTFKNIRENNIPVVKSCFALADKLYTKGNQVVKSALENVYVFSFSNLPIKNASDRNKLMGLIPVTLYSVYMKQVMHHGA